MTIEERHDIAKEVYNKLCIDYRNYSRETLTNLALIELNNNLELTADEIVEIIKPRLKKR